MTVIDCHIHCGVQRVFQPFTSVQPLLEEADIQACCLYPPVEDIYDRHDPLFTDTVEWQECRRKAHAYLLGLSGQYDVYPFFFVWNDFRKEDLHRGFRGIKWHRHQDEPVYRYDDPRCEDFLEKTYEMKLPIVLEEEYEKTLSLIDRIRGRTPVIIPHLGGLSGGYRALKEVDIWRRENVYADTALARPQDIADFIRTYGSEKLLFGSDFPFGRPLAEMTKVLMLPLRNRERENLLYGNMARLLNIE